ncbi:MAG: hypothetical protein LBG95_06500 [Treponema sp.]|jgi:hypothetical protein|nr:hypothetical protein [Treponema sp.]
MKKYAVAAVMVLAAAFCFGQNIVNKRIFYTLVVDISDSTNAAKPLGGL